MCDDAYRVHGAAAVNIRQRKIAGYHNDLHEIIMDLPRIDKKIIEAKGDHTATKKLMSYRDTLLKNKKKLLCELIMLAGPQPKYDDTQNKAAPPVHPHRIASPVRHPTHGATPVLHHTHSATPVLHHTHSATPVLHHIHHGMHWTR